MLEDGQVEELFEHWHEQPPVGVCVRHYLGIKPPTEPVQTPHLTEPEWEMMKRVARAEAERDGRVH